jgi:ABC-type multidrug transport system fused ATPase/permease subunit
MVEDVIQQFELVGRREQQPQVSTASSMVPSSIEIRNLTFYYHGSDTPSLIDINLKVQAGNSVAISGPSGSGKTTLVNVILGLLSPSSGSIFLDGIDVTKQTERWKGQIGYVPQDIFLTDDTIRNNIAFGIENDQIDEISVNRAVELSHVSHFIEQLPDGLNTLVGERGIRLSGGQRQRIGIARALYTNPSIIIFDEATSALDNETESAVVEAINSLQLGRTLFVIAHRESTLRHCNVAITMINGRLVSNPVGN